MSILCPRCKTGRIERDHCSRCSYRVSKSEEEQEYYRYEDEWEERKGEPVVSRGMNARSSEVQARSNYYCYYAYGY